MRRPPPQSILLLLALAPASALAYGFIGAESQAQAGVDLALGSLLEALLGLAVVASAGRLLLSLMPAGAPGSHQFGRLPFTWAASHLLGTLALGLQSQCWSARGFAAAWPWLLLAIARRMSLPAPMVPRHDPPSERLATSFRTSLWLLILGAAIVPGLLFLSGSGATPNLAGETNSAPIQELISTPFGSTAPLAGLAHWLAVCIFCLQGLELARRAPKWRMLLVAGLAAIPTAALAASHSANELSGTLFALAAATCAIGWLRRADRRLRALACLSLSALLPTAFIAALLALIAMVTLTPKPSRRTTALVACACAFAIGIPNLLTGAVEFGTLASWSDLRSQFHSLASTWLWFEFAWLTPLVLLGCLWYLLFQIGRNTEPDLKRPRIDAPGREMSFALVVLILCLCGLANPIMDSAPSLASTEGALRAARNLPWIGVGMLLLGLSWLPTERLTTRPEIQASSKRP